MTRGERLELLKQIEKDIHVCSLESTLLDDAKSCAIHSVIEELEQEPFINKPCVSSGVCEHDKNVVLDKIRAEIELLPTNTRINWDGCCPDIDYPEIESVDVSKAGLLEIINKYKVESENKE